jgi:hypothetical protein
MASVPLSLTLVQSGTATNGITERSLATAMQHGHLQSNQMRVDLHGMNAAEAEEAVGEMIAQCQQVALQNFLLKCVSMGLSADALERELACQRAELENIREELLAKFRAFVERGGKQLH